MANHEIVLLSVSRTHQAIKPRIIFFGLLLFKSLGTWEQKVVWKQSKYERITNDYDSV